MSAPMARREFGPSWWEVLRGLAVMAAAVLIGWVVVLGFAVLVWFVLLRGGA
ncbi:hypothetical protein [Nocardioides sp. R-C-SC26]|uniref:hypothetical protein n=1 Tax=Nocardioides sp. R-C-SC26 TaxID=2870414 RepID=UPI001E63E805|nr:hypothetical protein [Nocardioides sp. R-C-SC26]